MPLSNQNNKSLRLMTLEGWARAHYKQEDWTGYQFKEALEEYCLMTWGVTEGASKNMTKIVQLRMTRKKPAALELPHLAEPPLEEEKGMSLAEIIGGYRKANPEEFAVPKPDPTVVEET